MGHVVYVLSTNPHVILGSLCVSYPLAKLMMFVCIIS